MKLKVFALLIVICSVVAKEIIAYLPNWQWYDRNHLVAPESIDYSKYNILNYSFFRPLESGNIESTDTWADENLLFGQHDWVNGGYIPNTSVIDLAHNAQVKVLCSIGGWNDSNKFPQIASSESKRETFANNCVSLIQTYNFDGIDIDWEYPGFASHNGTALDKVNFTLLLQEIKDKLNILSQSNGKNYLLSACFSADPEKMVNIEWDNISEILDMINVMTYDYHGAFSSYAGHNSPLYASTYLPPSNGTINPDWCFSRAFEILRDSYNISPSKINLGVAFYGRSVTGCQGLHQSHSGIADKTTFADDEGSPLYYNVLKKINLFNEYWDDTSKVPYLEGKNIDTFVSYENEESVEEKSKFVVDNNARGVIVWELTGDYLETYPGSGVISQTPLIDKINQIFNTSSVNKKSNESNNKIVVNRVFSNNRLNFKFEKIYNGNIKIYNIKGQLIKRIQFNSKNVNFNCANLKSAAYFYEIQIGNFKKAGKFVNIK